MLSVEEAQQRVLEYFHTLEAEPVPILEALGRVLAEDVYADLNIPPHSNSAMDGYAVQAADTQASTADAPKRLRVIADLAAGHVADTQVVPGTAIRIMTGAPLPGGADSVVPFEDTDEGLRAQASPGQPIMEIGILCQVNSGGNVRPAGEDIRRGAVVLRRGTVLRPSEIGVLASLGYPQVKVIRRPVIAILATGDELTPPGQPLEPGRIYNSNSYSLAALVRQHGGIPKLLGIARDSDAALSAGIRQGLAADMLITSGGVSRGDYDIVKEVLAREGEITFWTVRMKPGKPLAFGRITGTGPDGLARSIPHLGLPGNPVSTMVTFEVFARPAMMKMMGRTPLPRPTVTAVLENNVVNRDGRRIYSRVIAEKRNGSYHARLTGEQGSGILTSMSLANGLAVIPEDRAEVRKGETVQVIMLDWNEGAER